MTYWERLLAEYVGGGDSPISPTLIAKSITTNGTYNAVDDEADGYSSVSVNVPNTSTLKGTLPLIFKTSEEQLRDWTIYGNNYEHKYSTSGTLPLTFTTQTAGAAIDWSISGNNNIGKNSLELSNYTIAVYGIYRINMGDGKLHIYGKSSNQSAFRAPFAVDTTLSAGTYTVTGTINDKFRLQVLDITDISNPVSIAIDDGQGADFTLTGETPIRVSLLVRSSAYNLDVDMVIKPMVRPADTSETFEPYQIGIGQRTKNKLEITATTKKINGVTFTIDKEAGTITANGTADAAVYLNLPIDAPSGDYYYSGCALGGSASTYDLFAWDNTISGRPKKWDGETNVDSDYGGTSQEIKVDSEHSMQLSIRIRSGQTVNNLVFKLMLRPAGTSADFVPYGYEVPLTINTTTQDIYIGSTPLTEGQSISKTSTGVDIAAIAGSNTVTTELYNKPEMAITGLDYVGVGEPVNDGWQIPLTVSDGTNTATVNVPIEAPLTSTDSVSGVVDIPTYVGTNTIDTTLVEPVTADIVYVGANSALINKTVNQNGTYFAYSDNANGYNSVAVDVPNTYTNEDESKVVHNGELVAQTTASVTANGIVDTTAIRSVSVNVPTAGSVTGDVRFLDYDGTVVQAYSKSDFASLTALPANPTHEGLTAQGWNWSLEDAKTYVAAYDKLDIGQMYITNDGKTRLYVTLDGGRLNPTLAIAVNGSCDVDWGDGTTHDTLTGTNLSSRVAVSHTYATGGDYVIALTVTGSFAFAGGSNGSLLFTYNDAGNDNRSKGYRNILRGVEIGDGITTINRYAFANCLTLSSITIPDSVTSIEDNVFNTCIALSSITIPDNVASVAAYAFDSCYSLSSVAIPKSVTLIGGDAFRYCYALSSVTIPSSVTRIGVDVFRYCYALSSVTIPNSVTEMGSYAFDSCYSLSSVIIPNSVTTIDGSVFSLCRTLVNVTIPNSITSISTYAFSGCTTLPSIVIPASVTSMGGNVFASCGSLSSIVFQSETPPTISSSSAFYNVPTDCIIYVPTGTLADYTSASNYPSSSSYTYVEY